jgi:hypothetical protein
MKMYLKVMGAAVIFMSLFGCGSGSGGPAVSDYVFPAGKATLTFTAMSTARLSVPLSGLDMSLTLPHGMSATASGASGQIDAASVTAGSALVGTNLAFGSYSASSGKTMLSMATTSGSFRSGEFLRLTCTVAPNTAISLSSLQALNSPVAVLKAVGYDPVTQSTVQLTGKIKVTVDALR